MTREDVERWIETIHGTPEQRSLDGAGQERLALRLLENNNQTNSSDSINLAELRGIYVREFDVNPWSVSYDFDVCEVAWEDFRHAQPALGLVLDYIFYSPGTVCVAAAEDSEWMSEMLDRAMGGKPNVSAGIIFCMLTSVCMLCVKLFYNL